MTRTGRLLLLSVAVLVALPAFTRADEGPVVIANQEKHPYLTLDPIHGAIGVTGYYEQDTNRSAGASAKSTDTLLTQDLTLSTGGAIISKNLASWTAGGTLSFDEEWITGGDAPPQAQTGTFDTYDLQLSVLPTTAFPFSIYANRTENLVTRPFAAMLRDITTTYGGSFHLNAGPLPSTLTIENSTSTQAGLNGDDIFTIDQTNIDYGTTFQPTERQVFSFNAHYAAVDQTNPGTSSTNSELMGINASHNWSLDGAGRYTLTQNVDYSTQTGNYPFTQLRIGEQLRLRHTANLESAINYTYDNREYQNSTTSRNSLSATVIHRLFSSLTTSVRAGKSWSDNTYASADQSTDAKVDDYFGDLTLSYQKKLFLGHLGANFNLGYDQNENSAIGVSQQILGDVQTFNDPQPITLTRPGINASSIAVFDASGTRMLLPGIDYTVRTVGRTVQISHITGGAIDPNSSVRLNYLIDPLPGYTTVSTMVGGGVNYLFEESFLKGLNPFIHYSQVNQSITPDSSGIAPDSVTDLVFGTEYRIWKLTFRAEDENRTSNLSPYTAQRFSLRYDDRIGDRTTVAIGATQNYMQYPLENSTTALTTIDARLQYQITRQLTSTVTARWRNEDDSRVGTVTGLDAEWELRWKIRQTEIFTLTRYTQLESQDNSADSLFFQIGISRSF